jgi:hypothetical protein
MMVRPIAGRRPRPEAGKLSKDSGYAGLCQLDFDPQVNLGKH